MLGPDDVAKFTLGHTSPPRDLPVILLFIFAGMVGFTVGEVYIVFICSLLYGVCLSIQMARARQVWVVGFGKSLKAMCNGLFFCFTAYGIGRLCHALFN